MKTVAIINLKGGTGKTVTTINLAAELQHRGRRVLCIDADPQHNLTDFYGADPGGATLTDLLNGRCAAAELCTQRVAACVSLVPSDLSLCEVDIEAVRHGVSLHTVRDLCAEVSEMYDVCLIDCPPSFTAASVAALLAADEVILPVTADGFALCGAAEIVRQVHNLSGVNPALTVRGVLITMWTRTIVCAQLADSLRHQLPLLRTHIRRSIKVQESTFARATLRSYAPDCTAAWDYDDLAEELLAAWEGNEDGEN